MRYFALEVSGKPQAFSVDNLNPTLEMLRCKWL
jgi:hypothetical protein